MKKWPWRKLLAILGVVLIVVGVVPLALLLWHGTTHNFQPLSMQLPLKQGEYTSQVFKTDLDEDYIVQIELMDPNNRAMRLNPDAILNLDWKIVDATSGKLIQQGAQNTELALANNVNLGDYHPKRGLSQKMIVDVHQDIAEPDGSKITLEVNSTEDPEGVAFGFVLFARWAWFVAGPGALILLVLLFERVGRRRSLDKPSRTPQTP